MNQEIMKNCPDCDKRIRYMHASGNKWAWGDCPQCYKMFKITKDEFEELIKQ